MRRRCDAIRQYVNYVGGGGIYPVNIQSRACVRGVALSQ